MFLDRGEDINEQSGPLGGVIHYTVAVPNGRTLEVLDLLIHEGADVNQPGPEGTPLEFLWKEANTRTLSDEMYHISTYRGVLSQLIHLGAGNNRRDPNGFVPSVMQMRYFGCNHNDYRECLRYYREGPLDGVSIWSRPVVCVPGKERPGWDFSFDDWSFPEHEAGSNSEDEDEDNGSSQSEDDYHSIDDVPTLDSERTSGTSDVSRAGEGHRAPGSTAMS
jgi:hypothetical protein